ncbi:hypothetical protein V6N12_028718 [Hibiscus sabdariffa]|uniref:Uncharacterized protein n=1 Tax=Hibiscus sabdariffa TaxID=183260 RepID=A0ABR2F6P7_9ROSI
MSIIGGNVNIRLSSSTESLKGPELKVETPTSGTKRRKGKKPVEAPPTEGALVFKKAFRNMKTKYLPYTKELGKVGGAPDDED